MADLMFRTLWLLVAIVLLALLAAVLLAIYGWAASKFLKEKP